ncbi:hypothetical protein [Agromyces archimandritae]|uniref:AbiEi antitoxin C-terminal domain-containing protein n=1 Tax=Agromyces archimandritae TaxID=2781962 RepID=A0A975FIV9_9MICO|nr:hypothetical protein [Agromyces archimandritae]QTX03303.1 hypothetical protein G127AT_07850 [Agromyces archimandritae]
MADDRRRALAEISAVVGTRRDRVVLSRESAAIVWGLPRFGPRPDRVELADAVGTLPHNRGGIRWCRTPFDPTEVVEIHGFLVTGLVQTLVDLACTRPFLSAVVALDAGIADAVRSDAGLEAPGADKEFLLQRLDEHGRRRGSPAARVAIGFADGASESVGESLSRGRMHQLGFPAPTLQREFVRVDGLGVDRADFDWEEYGVFGEFDGETKYLDEAMRGGRTIERVLLAEKQRADRIRLGYGRRDARWGWETARAPERLFGTLRAAGLPLVSRAA